MQAVQHAHDRVHALLDGEPDLVGPSLELSSDLGVFGPPIRATIALRATASHEKKQAGLIGVGTAALTRRAEDAVDVNQPAVAHCQSAKVGQSTPALTISHVDGARNVAQGPDIRGGLKAWFGLGCANVGQEFSLGA